MACVNHCDKRSAVTFIKKKWIVLNGEAFEVGTDPVLLIKLGRQIYTVEKLIFDIVKVLARSRIVPLN